MITEWLKTSSRNYPQLSTVGTSISLGWWNWWHYTKQCKAMMLNGKTWWIGSLRWVPCQLIPMCHSFPLTTTKSYYSYIWFFEAGILILNLFVVHGGMLYLGLNLIKHFNVATVLLLWYKLHYIAKSMWTPAGSRPLSLLYLTLLGTLNHVFG